MGTVRMSLQSVGVLKKLRAKGACSEAFDAADSFRKVLQMTLKDEPFKGVPAWKPTITPTLSGAEMNMTRPTALDQEQFETAVATAVDRFRRISPAPLFVA